MTMGRSALREGEVTIELPTRPHDAGLWFIGHIRTPWTSRDECPRQGDAAEGPLCRIELDREWVPALDGVGQNERLQILYWMHDGRRDLLRQSPRSDGTTRGTFSLRSPMRPNPVASSMVTLVSVEGNILTVRGLDCIDGTPLIDIKPEFCPVKAPAP